MCIENYAKNIDKIIGNGKHNEENLREDPSYAKKGDNGKLGLRDERMARNERSAPYVVSNVLIIECMKWNEPLIWVCAGVRQPALPQN